MVHVADTCNFSAFGAAYGTAKSGIGIASMAVMKPDLIMKSIIPVVMAGILAIYGLVVAALIAQGRILFMLPNILHTPAKQDSILFDR